MLREMGLGPIWRLRGVPDHQLITRPEEMRVSPADNDSPRNEAPPSSVSTYTTELKQRGGMPRPTSQENTVPTGDSVASNAQGNASWVAMLDWPDLEQAIRDCNACVLCERRNMAVPGIGDRNADWLLVGEGPGAEEDRKGEPFVGQAGKLLDAMLGAIGLSRNKGIYIANAVKCRPPGNRTPASEELAACYPFLARQIALLQPKLIIALGRPAAQVLLNREIRISAERGVPHDYAGIPLIVTYHPAYLLRNQHDKAKAWADLCLARRLVPPQV